MGYMWLCGLYVVICGYPWLYVVICGYPLYVVIHGYMGLLCGYIGLYVVIETEASKFFEVPRVHRSP